MKKRYRAYRYQILPRDRYKTIYVDELQEELTSQELISRKNEFFFKQFVLGKKTQFRAYGNKAIGKVKRLEGNLMVMEIGIQETVTLKDKNFIEKEQDHWPTGTLLVFNHPEVQVLLVEGKSEAHSYPEKLLHLFSIPVGRLLKDQYGLNLVINPIDEEREVWNVIDQYQGKIDRIKFELITPNLSNISRKVSEALKDLQKHTNSEKTHLELVATKGETLDHLSENDPQVADIIDYANQGGGSISFRVKGMTKYTKTERTEKYVELEEFEVNGASEEQLLRLIQRAGIK